VSEQWDPALLALLDKERSAITEGWVAELNGMLRGGAGSGNSVDLAPMYSAFLGGLRSGDGGRGPGFAEMRALLAEMSTVRARQGFTPTETAAAVFSLKRAITGVLGDGYLGDGVRLSNLIDDLGLFTFETFAAARESVIVSQSEQLLELSTPVVKLWDGVLAVPLVGTLDSARTQVVMETLLQSLVDTGSAHAIIDITGVAAVDTQVAQHLLKTVVAARLMGAECVISGIRPQIAQTVVALGIEFGDIPTRATLADALRHVLGQAGYDVVRRSGAPV
jgi:rsbT co-antagonist protein RsbR